MDSAVLELYSSTTGDSPRNISISSTTSISSSSPPTGESNTSSAINAQSVVSNTNTASSTASSVPAGAISSHPVGDTTGTPSGNSNHSYTNDQRHSHYKFSCNGVVREMPIEIFRYEFIDRTMIIISQTGKFGTVVEVKPLSMSQSYSNRSAGFTNVARDPNTGMPRLNTKVLLGLRDEPLLIISAQKLFVDIECSKPLVICFGIQRSSIEAGILSDIMEFVTNSLAPM